jgi:hypothetical protein
MHVVGLAYSPTDRTNHAERYHDPEEHHVQGVRPPPLMVDDALRGHDREDERCRRVQEGDDGMPCHPAVASALTVVIEKAVQAVS